MKHPIPEAALKKHIAILGMNGSGKTSVAKSQIMEPALDDGERVCNIDPTGVGWGLRLDRDGKRRGFAIYIVGGEHADFPLFRRDAKAWGEIVGTSSDSYAFDTSQMTVEDRSQWFTDFAETLIRKNKGPLKLVLDEAHLFAPQSGARSGGIAPRMLHATNNLLALGRSKGLIITMISQRPAKLHKDSLTQAHTLIAMALMAPQDRNAVKDWIADQADAEHGKDIIASLPTLKPGEGWVWAPKEGVLDRVTFGRPRTFDSSSAPADGDGAAVALSPINPDAIKARLAEVAKETVASDPKALRAALAERDRRIAELERATQAKGPASDPAAIDAAEQRGFEQAKKKLTTAMEKEFKIRLGATITALRAAGDAFASEVKTVIAGLAGPTDLGSDLAFAPELVARPVPRAVPSLPSRMPSRAKSDTPIADGHFTRPQTRVLESLAMWAALGHFQPSREMVAAVAGYSPSSGGFNNLLGGLKTLGAIDYPQSGAVQLSPEIDGIHKFGREAGRDMLLASLGNPHKKIIAALVDQGERTREQLGADTGYSPSSGGFNNLLGSLRTLGLIDYPRPVAVIMSDWAQELLSGWRAAA